MTRRNAATVQAATRRISTFEAERPTRPHADRSLGGAFISSHLPVQEQHAPAAMHCAEEHFLNNQWKADFHVR